MGRKVEETLIHVAVESARMLLARRLIAAYLPTDRNAPTLKVLKASGLEESANQIFSWDCSRTYPKPESVTLENLRSGKR
jgi:predicted enzyme involved in methoxymalonyl-ACP biosynthesis